MNRRPLVVVALLITMFVGYFSWFDLGRHAKANSGRFDLGNVEQTIWNVVHGHGFTMTDPYGTAQVSRLAFHTDLFLFFLVPLYALAPYAQTLLLLQVLAVASGGVAAYLIAKRIYGRGWWGVLFCLLYLLNPGLQWATIFDVHAVTFAAPLALWGVWAAMRQKYWLAMMFVLITMTTKEEVGLGLAAIGLFVWFWQRQRRWGVWLAFGPLAWALAMFLVVLPAFHGQSMGGAEVYRSAFGSGAAAIITGAITHPLQFFGTLFARHNLIYAWQLWSAQGFIGLLNPWWLAALPEFVINALSLKPAQHLLLSHYSVSMVPWLLLSTAASGWWLIRLESLRLRNVIVETALAVWLLGWLGYAVWATGPLPLTPNDQTKFVTWRNPYAATVAEWSRRIPAAAAVSVTNNVGAHFARREHLYSFPLGVEQADYIVVLEDHATPVVATQVEVSDQLRALRADPRWIIDLQQDELTVFHRRD